MIAPESIQQVISRSNIVDVIGQFVKLRKRGTNYIANCPFHNEKSPSFNVNPSKGIFKCFGCGKGGDVVSFVEEYEKFSFVEAIRWLANFYQIELNETEAPEEYKQQQQIEESLRIINDFAVQYFQDILTQNEEGRLIGGSYFKERGFRDNIIEQFRLGYSLDRWDAFVNEAKAKGYSLELMEKAGLVKVRDGKPYDNYRGRVIFPIFSNTGRVLGFGARILKKVDNAPKYVNSPENELYVKNKVLYGLYQSRQSIAKQNECFLVEGYTDVISLHQGGITNVVSSSGTSLTDGQLKLIGNLTRNLTILYDGDAAGIKAAMRGLDMALAESFNVKLVLLPDGEDPDSFIQKSGATAFTEYVSQHKRDVIGFRLEVGLKDVGNDPMKKSQLVNEIAETISKINKTEDFSLQQFYIRESANQLQIDEEGLINLVNKFIRDRLQQEQRHKERQEEQDQQDELMAMIAMESETGAPADTGTVNNLVQSEHEKKEWQLMRMLLEYGNKPFKEVSSVAKYIFETIDVELVANAMVKRMMEEYYSYWTTEHRIPDHTYFANHPDKAIKQKTADLLHEAHTPSANWTAMHKIEVLHGEDIYESEIESTIAYFELKVLRELMLENMKHMQTEQDPQKMAMLLKAHLSLQVREKELMTIVIIR